MRLRVVDLAAHAVRIVGSALALALVPAPWSVLAAIGLFLGLFNLAHDLVHGGLGLPRRARGPVLALVGVAMATSGHALRRMHLHHHARPLADDDLEGASARLTWQAAAWRSPRLALGLRIAAWRRAGRRERRWQLGEHLASAALIALAVIGPAPLAIHVAVAVIAQLTSPLWAGHVPHHLAGWPLAAIRVLAFTRSPTLLSLGFHDVHHDQPRVPCRHLAAAAVAGRGIVPQREPSLATAAGGGRAILST